MTNTATGAGQRIVGDLTTQQESGTCTLLDLTIQPIDLDLLGLRLLNQALRQGVISA
ncbi:MAG TPA: hypothetical protein VFW80_12505 [Gaiellaceae bacterium]|nr:hypothetical protein [Gaiellaceae bacterium]